MAANDPHDSDPPNSDPPAAHLPQAVVGQSFSDHPTWPRLIPDETQPWQTLSRNELAPPPHSLVRDRVQAHGGNELEYVYRTRGPRAVFVLPITPAGEAVLIRQYRYPLGCRLTEIVAGGLEAGESVQDAACRELAEEVGGVAGEWAALPGFYPQPSVSGVVFYALIAFSTVLGQAHNDPDELIERFMVPLPEVYRQLEAGDFLNGPSALVLFYARRELERRGLL